MRVMRIGGSSSGISPSASSRYSMTSMRARAATARNDSSWPTAPAIPRAGPGWGGGGCRQMAERPQTTVLEALSRRLAADPDDPYLDFEGDEYSARRMEAESNRLAHALGELGVGKGDRVATLLENGPAQVVSFFAALKLGAVQVPVNTAYKGDFLR